MRFNNYHYGSVGVGFAPWSNCRGFESDHRYLGTEWQRQQWIINNSARRGMNEGPNAKNKSYLNNKKVLAKVFANWENVIVKLFLPPSRCYNLFLLNLKKSLSEEMSSRRRRRRRRRRVCCSHYATKIKFLASISFAKMVLASSSSSSASSLSSSSFGF